MRWRGCKFRLQDAQREKIEAVSAFLRGRESLPKVPSRPIWSRPRRGIRPAAFRMNESSDVDPCCPAPCHPLPLRSSRPSRPAGHPAAAGAAFAHAGAVLLVEDSAGKRTSSTGSRTRSAIISPVSSSPSQPREFRIEVDLLADMTVYNPFDFFVEEAARGWPFQYEEPLKTDLSAYLGAEPAGPLLTRYLEGSRPQRDPYGGLPRRPQPDARSSRSLSGPAWSRAFRRRTEPCRTARAPAATPPGCWSRSCASSASPPASSPAI